MSAVASILLCAAVPRLVKVVVVSDELIVRAGLTMYICPEPDLDLVGETSQTDKAVVLIETKAPDVVILDLDVRRGIDLLKTVARSVPSAKILGLIGTLNTDQDRHSALETGARGLVAKNAPAETLVKAIRRVHLGEIWLERELLSSLVRRPPKPAAANSGAHQSHIADLTQRERTIITLIAEGLRNDQIAARAQLAPKTVRNHLWSVFNKLGVSDRLALAVYAFEHGLATPPG
jgi:DNA-binding NarL/FixJ family response regulator